MEFVSLRSKIFSLLVRSTPTKNYGKKRRDAMCTRDVRGKTCNDAFVSKRSTDAADRVNKLSIDSSQNTNW
jgi:hypothetical protein